MSSLERIPEPAILTSWKEIAAYLGKGVRTVQRWEKNDGLPVRRISGTSKIVVNREDLDQWLHAQPQSGAKNDVSRATAQQLAHNIEIWRALRRQNLELRKSMASALQKLVTECRAITAVADQSAFTSGPSRMNEKKVALLGNDVSTHRSTKAMAMTRRIS